MSPVSVFKIFCRLEDGNLTDSRLCRRFLFLIPFARRFKNRRLFNLPIGTGLSDHLPTEVQKNRFLMSIINVSWGGG